MTATPTLKLSAVNGPVGTVLPSVSAAQRAAILMNSCAERYLSRMLDALPDIQAPTEEDQANG